MKKGSLVLFVAFICLAVGAFGQGANNAQRFNGAKADLNAYKALYMINQSGEKEMNAVIRNINNALNDPRLKGKLQVELVAFGAGVDIFKKTNHLDTLLFALQKRGVLLVACENTMRERKILKTDLWPFIDYVPSGNGEIIIRHFQGWATIHP